MAIAPTLDLAAVKAGQQATWASGDYAEIATLIVPISERLADAADLRAGSTVLDVASGSGNMAIAAARLGCEVTGVDYVASLLDRGRRARRSGAAGRGVPARRRGSAAVRRRLVRRDRVGRRVDVRPRSRARRGRARPRDAAGRHDRARELDAGRLRRRDVPDGRRARPAAGRRGVAAAVGRRGVPRQLFGTDVGWTHRRRTFTFRFARLRSTSTGS